MEKKKELDLSARKEQNKNIRNEKSKSPIRQTPIYNDVKPFTPIQFKKKGSNFEEEKVTARELSKSPIKRTSNLSTAAKDLKSLT